MQHVTVYREQGRYAGWPANYGIWSWGDEIVVGFTVGYHRSDGGFHARDSGRPFTTMQARSLNGGTSWQTAPTPCREPGGRGLSADEHVTPALRRKSALDQALEDCPGRVDFTHPDFALMCARTGLEAGARSWFYLSTDRCRSWDGPYRLPMFGQSGIAARTDYLVGGPAEALLFLTAAKSDGHEGRVFCARTTNRGRSFRFVSWVGAEPAGYAIMPASVRLPGGRILTAVRRREDHGGTQRCWIDLYASDDSGSHWAWTGEPVSDTGTGGNPPTLTRLTDGRICMTYGYRSAPCGIRAVVSSDAGATWGEPITLRADGGNHDLGYPRTVQRPDGRMLTVYYYNDAPEGDRYIAATIWEL